MKNSEIRTVAISFQHERCKLIETKTKLSGNLMTSKFAKESDVVA